jgi:hypothetical protein
MKPRLRFVFRTSTKLLGSFRSPSPRGLLVPRSRAVTLLEARAAAGVAALFEGRCEVVAAAVSADQLFRTGRRSRWPRRVVWGFRRTSGLRCSSDGLLLRGRDGFAASRARRFRRGFGFSVQVRSPSLARAWCPCRREHTLLCRRDVGSESSHKWLKIVGWRHATLTQQIRPDGAAVTRCAAILRLLG